MICYFCLDTLPGSGHRRHITGQYSGTSQRRIEADRHQNGSNALFLDAHVEFRTDNYILDLVNWDDQLYSDRR